MLPTFPHNRIYVHCRLQLLTPLKSCILDARQISRLMHLTLPHFRTSSINPAASASAHSQSCARPIAVPRGMSLSSLPIKLGIEIVDQRPRPLPLSLLREEVRWSSRYRYLWHFYILLGGYCYRFVGLRSTRVPIYKALINKSCMSVFTLILCRNE